MDRVGDRALIAHLLRRTGFGPTAAEVDAAVQRGYEATVSDLLSFGGADPADNAGTPAFAPVPRDPLARRAAQAQRAAELRDLQGWWLQRMVTTSHPLREKLTLFWHGHFATSFEKVQRADLMFRQNQLFRSQGAGDFEALTQAVAKDPAMMLWLDTSSDKAAHPNENFARELMELFTLGIGNYSEDDVREAARAFTGWVLDPTTETWALRVAQHDAGVKTVLGRRGAFGGEDVVHLVCNAPAGEAFMVASLWSHFAYPVAASDPVVTSLLPAYRNAHSVSELLRAVLLHPAFVGPAAVGGLVKQPIEWVTGAMRVLRVPPGPRAVTALTGLGQVPFRPPDVGGWPQNQHWLTTASSMVRLQVASALAKAADLSAVSTVGRGSRVDAAGHLLSVEWSAETAAALSSVASDPTELISLALVSPEYVVA